jgi:uncharacterized protein (TIGR03790 family)
MHEHYIPFYVRIPLFLVALLSLSGCSQEPGAPAQISVGKPLARRSVPPAPSADAARVLVVVNDQSDVSKQIADYYCRMRGVPAANVAHISVTPQEEINKSNYGSKIEAPVKAALGHVPNPIDFIVLTKGIPIRIQEYGWSVDSFLGAMDLKFEPMGEISREGVHRSRNPYFKSAERFSHKNFGFYLVSRLDGYDLDACLDLVDHSCLSKPLKGLYFCDQMGWHDIGPEAELHEGLATAVTDLKKRGFDARLDSKAEFVAPPEPMMGYWSNGSNDRGFSLATYKRLLFASGGIAETNVSTSARTFQRTTGGQSLIADLIEQGATGAKGYVSEPYDFAIAKPEILFDRYTHGFNLAESFYGASMLVKWKDLVVGDPICRPYGG